MKFKKLVKAEQGVLDNFFNKRINDLNKIKDMFGKMSQNYIKENSKEIDEAMQQLNKGIDQFYFVIEILPMVKK